MELTEVRTWQIPAQWSIGRQWLMIIVVTATLLGGGCLLWLCPTWQHYRQLVMETEALLQQAYIASASTTTSTHGSPLWLPPTPQATLTSHLAHRDTLPHLMEHISRLTERPDLLLISLQQQPSLPQGERLTQPIVVELTGAYLAIKTFVTALGLMSHCLAINEISVVREHSERPLKLRLSLLFYPAPPPIP